MRGVLLHVQRIHPCGHVFCKECLQKLPFREKNDEESQFCPTCRQAIQTTATCWAMNDLIQEIVQKRCDRCDLVYKKTHAQHLRTECPQKCSHCDQSCPGSDGVEQHQPNCPDCLKCPHCSRLFWVVEELDRHRPCPLSPCTCDLCGESHTFEKRMLHIQLCPERVACCGNYLSKADYETHASLGHVLNDNFHPCRKLLSEERCSFCQEPKHPNEEEPRHPNEEGCPSSTRCRFCNRSYRNEFLPTHMKLCWSRKTPCALCGKKLMETTMEQHHRVYHSGKAMNMLLKQCRLSQNAALFPELHSVLHSDTAVQDMPFRAPCILMTADASDESLRPKTILHQRERLRRVSFAWAGVAPLVPIQPFRTHALCKLYVRKRNLHLSLTSTRAIFAVTVPFQPDGSIPLPTPEALLAAGIGKMDSDRSTVFSQKDGYSNQCVATILVVALEHALPDWQQRLRDPKTFLTLFPGAFSLDDAYASHPCFDKRRDIVTCDCKDVHKVCQTRLRMADVGSVVEIDVHCRSASEASSEEIYVRLDMSDLQQIFRYKKRHLDSLERTDQDEVLPF